MGAAFLICGIFPVLIAQGIITPDHAGSDNAPPWVLMCAGAAFMAAGGRLVTTGYEDATVRVWDLPAFCRVRK